MSGYLLETRPITYYYDIVLTTVNTAKDGEKLLAELMEWVYATDGINLNIRNGKWSHRTKPGPNGTRTPVVECTIKLEGTSKLHNEQVEKDRIEKRLRETIEGYNEKFYPGSNPKVNGISGLAIRSKSVEPTDADVALHGFLSQQRQK